VHHSGLQCGTWQWVAGWCIAVSCSVLHCIVMHCSALQFIALWCIAVHCSSLHCDALQCIAVRRIAVWCSRFCAENRYIYIYIYICVCVCVCVCAHAQDYMCTCTALRSVYVWCSVVHCIVLWCNALQNFAVCRIAVFCSQFCARKTVYLRSTDGNTKSALQTLYAQEWRNRTIARYRHNTLEK